MTPISCAVYVAKIATGQIEETHEPPAEPEGATPSPAVGGGARAAKLTADERAAQAKRAANARLGKRADA